MAASKTRRLVHVGEHEADGGELTGGGQGEVLHGIGSKSERPDYGHCRTAPFAEFFRSLSRSAGSVRRLARARVHPLRHREVARLAIGFGLLVAQHL